MATPDASAKTLRQIFDAGVPFLQARGVEDPRLAMEWLAARLYSCGRLDLHRRLDAPVAPAVLDAMRRGTQRLATGEPVQYILGQWEFHGHPFKTDRRALVPRPETESLVDLVLEDAGLWSLPSPPRIVDIGTGTGCIALTLALERPRGRYMATDVSADALALARENAAALGVSSVRFVQTGDLSDVLDHASVDAIVSNPPYIPSADVDRLAPTVRNFEPRLALDGGPDGLDILRSIAEEASMVLADGGRLFLELDAESNQAPRMTAFLSDLGFDETAVHRDRAGRERFVSGRLAPSL